MNQSGDRLSNWVLQEVKFSGWPWIDNQQHHLMTECQCTAKPIYLAT